MKDTNKKMKLFRNLSNLKEADPKYKCLSIQHDQTYKEREEGKKLLEEARAKESRDLGKCIYRVRGPPWARKIVKIKPSKGEEERH